MLVRDVAYNTQATHWPRTGNNGFGGDAVGSPTIVMVRWENDVSEKIEGMYKAAGETLLANGIVWSSVKLAQGDWLYLGISSAASPLDAGSRAGVDKAFIIRRVTEIPDVRGVVSEYVSYL